MDVGERLNDDEASAAEPLAPAERKLVTQSYDLSVGTLMEQWDDGTLVLPEIQREYVWTNSKASRLIESLLLNVPIPVLYFAEGPEDTYEVIDGHQRVASIARYIGNEFPLSGLKVLADSERVRKRFHQLPTGDQRRIRTRVIRAIIITDESHPSMKFEVFERLNTGSIALNAQEIRNSTHRGPFMQLVKELVLMPEFRTMVGQKQPRKRMADHELIIRFLALRADANEYRPPLDRFLNAYAARANLFDEVELGGLKQVFDDAVRNLDVVFMGNAFRLTDEKGNRVDRSLNRALAEVQLVTFSKVAHSDAVAKASELTEVLGRLHSSAEFLDSIQRATGDRARMASRLLQYRTSVESVGVELV